MKFLWTPKSELRRFTIGAFVVIIVVLAIYILLYFFPPLPTGLKFGEKCKEDFQCKSGLCVALSKDTSYGYCTISCSKNEQCPEGYSCSGVTNKGVVVCSPGPATPFGR